MMSSVCQGLQSQVKSDVLSFQLFPHIPSRSEVGENSIRNRGEDCKGETESGENGRCWSFLEAVSNGNGKEEEMVYVHDVVKRSSTRLSKKSLEMCTESLGSESGSDVGENDMCFLSLEADSPSPPSVSVRTCSTWGVGIKKANRRTITFPPPLTSISGSNGVRVESYREDGRLVLRAVATSASRTTYFHAERTKGRLRLQLLKHMEPEDDDVRDGGDRLFGVEVEEEEEEAYRPETTGESHGEEMGMENFTRPCSCSCSCRCNCKQGRRHTKELLNWKPLWVFT